MHLPVFVLVLFMVFSYHVSAVSWLQNPYLLNIIAFGKQPSSNSSLLLANTSIESMVDHFALYNSNTFPESVLTGGMGTFDVYSFTTLSNNQISASAIWVTNERGHDERSINAAVAGWEVNPKYGDNKTHFVTAWTNDAFKSTGCKNLDCNGFVPVNYAPITPGDTIEAIGGQKRVTIKIFKSKDDGDWWLHFGYDNQNLSRVGYWPKNIFTNLADHANYITWGGFTRSSVGDGSPAMGNGQWPGETSAFIRDIKYVNTDGQGDYEPAPGHMGLRAAVTHPKCYGLGPFINDTFSYGGPGGCTE
uniref:Uncharacterized protein n=1 Tax=Avena sativa TaxID=4498 RepID=A0ACD5U251_AVESA